MPGQLHHRKLPVWGFMVILLLAGAVVFTEGLAAEQTRGVSINITGNWYDGVSSTSKIRTREPVLNEGQTVTFHQTLYLPTGQCAFEFEYTPYNDYESGRAIQGRFNSFDGFCINGRSVPLSFEKDTKDERFYRAMCELPASDKQRELKLSLTFCHRRPLDTRLFFYPGPKANSRFCVVPPENDGQWLLVRGIPFQLQQLDYFRQMNCTGGKPFSDMHRANAEAGNKKCRTIFECNAVRAKTLHCLGMTHSVDIGNGSWYSAKGDHGFSHFVGDRAGDLVIHWTDGGQDVIPLIFGFNLWYSRPWDLTWSYNVYRRGGGASNRDSMLFKGKDEFRDIIADGLCLRDGYRPLGSDGCNARFIFSVDLNGRAVDRLEVKGNPEIYGLPVISAVTFEGAANSVLPAGYDLDKGDISADVISLNSIRRQEYKKSVCQIQHTMYTFVDEVPKLKKPEIPAGYFGPHYDFRGTQEAIRAATFLYRNGPECGSHVADSGVGCSSPVSSGSSPHYCWGFGIWYKNKPFFGSLKNWFHLYRQRQPGELPGRKNAWSRGVGELLRESMAFGYGKFALTYLDWIDRAIFEEANPPHWNRVVGAPTFCTSEIRVGDVTERGNRENDGHGIIMWGRYMVWHWLGRPRQWNEDHFRATKAAVDWIRWQLDTDKLRPGKDKDVLFTQSECAHNDYDIYSSYNCLHGIKLSIRMARQLGRDDLANEWQQLYLQLRQGILDHLVDQTDCGLVWHTEPGCDWQDHAHKLVPLHLSTEGDSYTPLQDYAAGDEIDRRILEISRNSYRYLMRQKNYNCLRMFGYGQGMMAQGALLLDEMADAEQFINVMVDHCYLPFGSGWAAPEGIILHRSGKFYVPVNGGYAGQDSHLADSTKAVRLMLGVDDNDPEHLRLVPRFPSSWNYAQIHDYPVLTGSKRQHIAYILKRTKTNLTFKFQFDQEVPRLDIRLGPLPKTATIQSAGFNGRSMSVESFISGDSQWLWCRKLAGKQGVVNVLWH